MAEIAASTIFFLSFSGIVYMIYRKIPFLLEIPREPSLRMESIPLEKKSLFLRFPSLAAFLQKILSKARALTLSFERRISGWLEIIHKRSKEKRVYHDEAYWTEVEKKPAPITRIEEASVKTIRKALGVKPKRVKKEDSQLPR